MNEETPTPVTPTVVSGDGGLAPPSPTQPVFTPTELPVVTPARRRLPGKKLLLPVLAALLLVGSASAYYFGYYNNPSAIYSQSLENTGKGYDKLISYIDAQSQLDYNGYSGNGDFNFKSTGFATDGKISYKGDDANGDLKFDVGISGNRLEFDLKAIKGAGTNPDLYIKAKGLKGLGALAGAPELDAKLASLNDTWIVIDHTFLDSLQSAAAAEENALKTPSREQIMDALKATAKVNQEYVFSTDKDKAVLKVVKNLGKETVDDHSTYRYEVALQKDNYKKYVSALKSALKSSKLHDWIKQNKYEEGFDSALASLELGANNVKDANTVDVWMDAKQRILYKVRFADPKNKTQDYYDLGLDYKGGDSYPFFLASHSKQGDGNMTVNLGATLNSTSGKGDFKFELTLDGTNASTAKVNFSFAPSRQAFKVEKPANAKPLAQALSELGYGDVLNQLQALSTVY